MEIQLKKIIPANDPVCIAVIGAGGTGSHLLSNLAALNDNMIKLDYPGLKVVVFDDDVVTYTNVGRQKFSQEDVGQFKAQNIVEKINFLYGFDWTYTNERFSFKNPAIDFTHPGIIISCVDSINSRKYIFDSINDPFKDLIVRNFPYWMDIGNGMDFGQVILGSVPFSIPTVMDVFQNIDKAMEKKDENDTGCSTLNAMMKQSLYINQFMALLASNMLKELLFNMFLPYSMIFTNLKSFEINVK